MLFRLCRRLLSLLAPAILLASAQQTLREAADSAHFLIGAAVRPSLFSEAAYSATLAREFNMIEPEDVMKWSIIRRDSEKFDFTRGDDVVRFAKAHGMKVRGHCLVWDHDNPEWLSGPLQSRPIGAPASPAHLDSHEALHRKRFRLGRGQRSLGRNWKVQRLALVQPARNRTGRDRICLRGQAFRWAHQADPHALLFYNDNGGEGLSRKSDAIYAMVKDFKRRGVPIDGVGLQMHISKLDIDTGAVASNIARLTALGLQVHITELDVSLPLRPADSLPAKEDILQQAAVYRGVVRACLRNPGCTAIQTWGFTDKWSWIGSHSHGTRGAALPFDRTYRPKPAYDAMLEEIARQRDPAH